MQIFYNNEDYKQFEKIMEEAVEKYKMRLLAYCIMPNHWHLVLYSKKDGDLSLFMGWLTNTHTRRWHTKKGTVGQAHLYQGRYKSFICQKDNYFLTLARYVERNAKKANLVQKAENWEWSSVWKREKEWWLTPFTHLLHLLIYRVIVIQEDNLVFDHAKIANKLLKYAKNNYNIDWFVFLDADEFLSVKDKTIHEFVDRLENKNIPYATIGWVNALFDYTMSDYTCSPVTPIDTTKYYFPWSEKQWQEGGHFRKAIVKNHDSMEIVVGGHYVETGNDVDFFGEYHWNPFVVPYEEVKILHFELRGKANDIYNKWKNLADYESDSTSDKNDPWMERITTIKRYVKEFKDN